MLEGLSGNMKKYTVIYKHGVAHDEIFSVHDSHEEASQAIEKIIEKAKKDSDVAHKYVRGISHKLKKENFRIQESEVLK